MSRSRLNGRYVSADHFDVFGVQPLIGRAFRPDEDHPGANRVVVLSHAAWQQRFGGDRGILNRDLLLDDVPHASSACCRRASSIAIAPRPLDEPAASGSRYAFTEKKSRRARTG